jgi:hypothetical protein
MTLLIIRDKIMGMMRYIVYSIQNEVVIPIIDLLFLYILYSTRARSQAYDKNLNIEDERECGLSFPPVPKLLKLNIGGTNVASTSLRSQ